MKYIVVDLEMNPLSKEYYEERKQCRNEIIQIGAVVLDENYQEIGCFKTLVKPQYNEIISALNPVPQNATLGELFNFSEFALIS